MADAVIPVATLARYTGIETGGTERGLRVNGQVAFDE